MSKISGYSQFKLKQIKNHWLSKKPPILSNENYQKIKYVILDATYFHHENCLIVFIDATTGRPFFHDYGKKESYEFMKNIAVNLRQLGLNPKSFTTDGNKAVMSAISDVWSDVIIQRCLVHIQRQSLQWLRQYPKTQAAKELKDIVGFCANIKTSEDAIFFLEQYKNWIQMHYDFVSKMPNFSIAFKDLKRTMTLIDNALKNMFHFLRDQNIVSSTNYIENFFKQLKHKYRCHNGLCLNHKIAYLEWYCFYKNTEK